MSSIMLDENWLWKSELVSPSGVPSLLIDPNWLSIDPNLVEKAVNTDDCMLYEESNAYNEVINKTSIEKNESIKEEPLQDWFEEKINFSIYDGLPTKISNSQPIEPFVNPSNVIPQSYLQPTSAPVWEITQPIQIDKLDEPDLLDEITSLINSKRACAFQPIEVTSDFPMKTINEEELYTLVMQDSSLPSPSSLPHIEEQILSPVNSPHSSAISDEVPPVSWNTDELSDPSEYQNNQIDEEDEDEELDHSTKEPLNIDFHSNNTYIKDESVLSPSSESSISENFDLTETSLDDPDWSLCKVKKTIRKYKRTKSYTRKPYVKVSPAERKVRKKEQNKNAATRYRMKKKQEISAIVNEEQQLLEKNKELKEKTNDLERETKYLKKLLRDLYVVKGLIK